TGDACAPAPTGCPPTWCSTTATSGASPSPSRRHPRTPSPVTASARPSWRTTASRSSPCWRRSLREVGELGVGHLAGLLAEDDHRQHLLLGEVGLCDRVD